jgi:phage terminase large subunit GpA-like protein
MAPVENTILNSDPDVALLIRKLLKLVEPRELLPPAEWAEKHRILPAGAAAKYGKWRNFPFQVEPLNCVNDSEVSSLTLCFASQVLGKTSIVENAIGWMIDQAPCAAMIVFPTGDNAENWSKNRLGPLIQPLQ